MTSTMLNLCGVFTIDRRTQDCLVIPTVRRSEIRVQDQFSRVFIVSNAFAPMSSHLFHNQTPWRLTGCESATYPHRELKYVFKALSSKAALSSAALTEFDGCSWLVGGRRGRVQLSVQSTSSQER